MPTIKDLKFFVGGTGRYYEFAQKGDTVLGVEVGYSIAARVNEKTKEADQITVFIVRFAAISGTKIEPMLNFKLRQNVEYQRDGLPIPGARLNKILIPVFDKPLSPVQMNEMCQDLGVWQLLGGWVHEQAEKDGFTVTVPDVELLVRVAANYLQDMEEVKLIIELKDLPDMTFQQDADEKIKPSLLDGLGGEQEDGPTHSPNTDEDESDDDDDIDSDYDEDVKGF